MLPRYSLAFLLLFACTLRCRRLDVESLDFFKVSTKKAERLTDVNVGAVLIEGSLTNTGGHPVQRCGFVWSEDLAAISASRPLDNLPELMASVLPLGDDNFTAVFSFPRPKVPIYFRAFAQAETDAGTRKVFAAEIKAFSLGEMVAMTENEPIISNDRMTVEGRLIGWKDLQANAIKHGFIYSSKNQDPKLRLPDCVEIIKDTVLSDDYDFAIDINGLEFNTDYYIRSYATTTSDTFYSAEVKKSSVTDGWKRLKNDLPGFHADGVNAVHNGKAYLGLGCQESGFCLLANLTKQYLQFDPVADSEGGGWNNLAPFGGSISPANAVSFVIRDTVFVLFGGYQAVADGTLFNLPLLGFWKYLPNTNQWIYPPQPPSNNIYGRSSAVAFVLNDKAYVGSGYYEDSNDNFKDYYLNDFWEYNSVNGLWRAVKKLPVIYNGTEHPDWGRYEAAAFVVEGKGYVGGGFGQDKNLSDFWEFIPPVNDQDPGDWKFISSFQGKTRIDAVSFSINGKGYYGLGYHQPDSALEPYGYYLNDWWEFSPNTATWKPRTPFQGGRRGRGFGFGIGSAGFVGGGLLNQLDSSQTVIIEGLRTDFWKYTPAIK